MLTMRLIGRIRLSSLVRSTSLDSFQVPQTALLGTDRSQGENKSVMTSSNTLLCQFASQSIPLFNNTLNLQEIFEFEGSPMSKEAKLRGFLVAYQSLEFQEETRLLCELAEACGVNHSSVANISKQLLQNQDQGHESLLNLEEKLKQALTPRYVSFFKEIGKLEGGVKFLVDMRKDLLMTIDTLPRSSSNIPSLKSMSNSLKELLAVWFSVGMLQLQRITWETPCDLLQKVAAYEAVHPVRHWTDIKRRVGRYRRCFVFLHHAMPKEPLVVLHTALTTEISSCIQDIVPKTLREDYSSDCNLDSPFVSFESENPDSVKAAVFYSISSTQRGLQGVELGHSMIKRVVRELQNEFPRLSQFSSLSPIPGFRNWLMGHIKDVEMNAAGSVLSASDLTQLEVALGSHSSVWSQLRDILSNNHWVQQEELRNTLKMPLLKLCAQYLYKEKRRGYALNEVANFHLRNGAVLWRINWLADTTVRGLTQSCGLMVNYRYFLEDCESNMHRYSQAKEIKISEQIEKLIPVVHKL